MDMFKLLHTVWNLLTSSHLHKTQFSEHIMDPDYDQFLLLASDGLWEFMSDEECVKIASRGRNPADAISELAAASDSKWWSRELVSDDLTICMAYF